MKIHRLTSPEKKKGFRYDPKSQEYVSYQIDVRVGGQRRRDKGFGTRKAAQDFVEELRLNQKYKRAGMSRLTSPRVSELLKKRLEKIKSHSEQVRGERVFQLFRDQLNGDPKVTDISTGDFQLFINSRKGVKPETVNREINLLSKAFRSAPELFPKELDGYEPPKIPRPKFKRKRREKIISPEGKDAILKHLYKPGGTEAEYQNRVRIGRMFELAWFLGMAYNEVAHLKKSAYDGTGLEFVREKTGNPVKFEWLPERVHQVLSEAIESSETDYVFTHSGSTPKHFYKIMKDAIEAAGLTYGRDTGITFHSARHSFVTNAMRHGDLKTVGSMSGHSDETMVLLYTHATPESRKRVLQAMHSHVDWRDIFERVRAGKMSFEEFEKLVK